ncbi:hypothetical protein JOE26_000355 [Rhodococcus coprophilus]|uniref:Uncharacterized protein n=1 Tax=Rhodococcus coprophilus TaxID=38310 RepID=A0A2X4TV24_9NOCA|nr:hypothetical protein [Rhodococcus coprophilus]SQI30179.1 Uncharacterised protein [Rhodococcus coprophilus]
MTGPYGGVSYPAQSAIGKNGMARTIDVGGATTR